MSISGKEARKTGETSVNSKKYVACTEMIPENEIEISLMKQAGKEERPIEEGIEALKNLGVNLDFALGQVSNNVVIIDDNGEIIRKPREELTIEEKRQLKVQEQDDKQADR